MRETAVIGAILQVFGPAFAVLTLWVFPRPQLCILAVAGAFGYVIALFLSSLWWTMIPPVRTSAAFHVIFGILFQELVRMLLCYGVAKAEKVFRGKKQTIYSSRFRCVTSGLALGLGFGIASALMNFTTLVWGLWETNSGYSTVYDWEMCPHLPLLQYQSLYASMLVALHTIWTGLALPAMLTIIKRVSGGVITNTGTAASLVSTMNLMSVTELKTKDGPLMLGVVVALPCDGGVHLGGVQSVVVALLRCGTTTPATTIWSPVPATATGF